MREKLEGMIAALLSQGFEDCDSVAEIERQVRAFSGSVVPARLFLAWLERVPEAVAYLAGAGVAVGGPMAQAVGPPRQQFRPGHIRDGKWVDGPATAPAAVPSAAPEAPPRSIAAELGNMSALGQSFAPGVPPVTRAGVSVTDPGPSYDFNLMRGGNLPPVRHTLVGVMGGMLGAIETEALRSGRPTAVTYYQLVSVAPQDRGRVRELMATMPDQGVTFGQPAGQRDADGSAVVVPDEGGQPVQASAAMICPLCRARPAADERGLCQVCIGQFQQPRLR